MANPLTTSLLITVIGMGLVFGAILLLWGIMAVLVRLTADRSTPNTEDQPAHPTDEAVEAAGLELKRRAAAAAVSIALSRQQRAQPAEFPIPQTAAVSPWQSVMRTKMLNKRGPVR